MSVAQRSGDACLKPWRKDSIEKGKRRFLSEAFLIPGLILHLFNLFRWRENHLPTLGMVKTCSLKSSTSFIACVSFRGRTEVPLCMWQLLGWLSQSLELSRYENGSFLFRPGENPAHKSKHATEVGAASRAIRIKDYHNPIRISGICWIWHLKRDPFTLLAHT